MCMRVRSCAYACAVVRTCTHARACVCVCVSTRAHACWWGAGVLARVCASVRGPVCYVDRGCVLRGAAGCHSSHLLRVPTSPPPPVVRTGHSHCCCRHWPQATCTIVYRRGTTSSPHWASQQELHLTTIPATAVPAHRAQFKSTVTGRLKLGPRARAVHAHRTWPSCTFLQPYTKSQPTPPDCQAHPGHLLRRHMNPLRRETNRMAGTARGEGGHRRRRFRPLLTYGMELLQ